LIIMFEGAFIWISNRDELQPLEALKLSISMNAASFICGSAVFILLQML